MGTQRGIAMVYFMIVWSLVVFLAASKAHGNDDHRYYHVGCYREDSSHRALPILLANYSKNYSNNIIKKIRECADTAKDMGYNAFGVQKDGECWSGIDAIFVYGKYGNDSSCTNGVGGVKANDVYFLSHTALHVACANENNPTDRALPILVFNKTTSDPIQSCGRAALKKGFTFFGLLMNGSECWSGKNASVTYKNHGIINGGLCFLGLGRLIIDVYRFKMSVPTTSVPQATATPTAVNTPTTEARICPSGYISTGSPKTCQPCPVDKYKHNERKCNNCGQGKKTWGRKAVARQDQCTAENPIKVSNLQVYVSPDDVKPGLIVANFSASYDQVSLVIPPLTYTITDVTKSPSQPVPRTSDETSGDMDSCFQLASNSSFPFCIYHDNGSIATNKNFNCSEGDKFVISINVFDSGNDTIGTIVNPNGKVTINCVDVCKDVTRLYEKARNACSRPVQINDTTQVVINSTNIRSISEIKLTNITGNSCSTFSINMTHGLINITINNVSFGNIEGRTSVRYRFEKPIIVTGPTINITLLSNSCITSASLTLVTVPKHPERCDVRWKCLDAVYNWANSLNVGKCGDPDNLRMRYGHCVGKPKITRGPESKSVASGTKVTLSCVVSSSLPASITWYGGKYAISTSTVTMDVNNQGYYWCKASNRYGTVRSGRALLVVTDYFTSLISFKAKPKSRNRQDPCQSCGQIADYLSNNDQAALKERYKHKTTCRHWEEWSNKIGVECVIYGKKESQDEDYFDSYYSNLTEIITGAKKNMIEGLRVYWKSTLVKDTGLCFKETTGKQNIKGFFTWNATKIGESNTTDCPLGPSGSSATRTCGGDFSTGAGWNTPDDDGCNYKSKKTEAMNKLSKEKLNPHNAKDAAKSFTKLFKSGSAKDMSEADADLAADMVDNILSVESMLNETADMVVEIIDTMMEMNSSNLKANASTRIVKALDKVAEKIPLEEGTTSRVLNSTNLAIQANEVNPSTFEGLGFGISKNGDDGKSVVTSEDLTSLFVKLPKAVVENSNKTSSTRIGFIYFANNNFFTEEDEDEDEESENEREPSDEVLSSSVFNTNTSKLSENVTLSFPRPERKELRNSSCVYWNEGARRWSNEGCFPCDSDSDDEASVECCCNHLTSFAVLFSPQSEPLASHAKHAKILSIISYIGCGISLAGVVLTFLTYSLFRHLRKTNQQPILMSLCVAIAMMLIVFAVGVDRTSDKIGCQISAALLHYFTLATVLWMGIEAYNLYLQLVKVMAIYHRKFMLKASIFAWGVPAIIVAATVIAAVIEYKGNEDSNPVFYYGNDKVCILHNYTYRMVSWFVPILVIILFNLVTFILVIYKLNCTGAMVPVDTKSNQKKRCWTALAIMSLLGLTWLFGALAISGARLAFEYLFCFFNSLQGFFIFFFHCIRIKEVRNQWSFFVSGLGFSHRESETSHQRSRGFGESHHSSEAPYVKVKNWILRKESNSDQPKRKITMTTIVDDKNVHGQVRDENKVDIELDEVRDPHENDALEESSYGRRRDSHSSKGSTNNP